ncbi:MAG: phage protein Gp36 family protein [Planctomycetota bacterium]
MSYATLDDLKQRLGSNADPPGAYEQLTDRVTLTTGDDAVGQEVLEAAHGEVNGWLAKRYTVPIAVSADATLAQRLRGVTLDLAEHGAWETSPTRITTPKRVADNYAAAIRWLTEVAAGGASLPGVTEVPAATVNGPTAMTVGHEARFTEDNLKGL